MSAFVPDKLHYDLIVKTIIDGPRDWYEVCDYGWNPRLDLYGVNNADELGELLLRETVKSVSYRYDGDEEMIPDWAREPYRFEDHDFQLNCIEFLKALNCYEYQSCEHPEWKSSEAMNLISRLWSNVASCIIDTVFYEEYEEAPWVWEDVSQMEESQDIFYRGRR